MSRRVGKDEVGGSNPPSSSKQKTPRLFVGEFFAWSKGLNVKGTLIGSFHSILLSETLTIAVDADLIGAKHV